MEKMTKVEMYTAIVTFATEQGREDLVEFANHEIELLQNRAAKAKERAAAKAAEPDEMMHAIQAVLTAEPQTVDQIVAALDNAEYTKGKVVARLTKLVNGGSVVKSEVKVEKTETAKAHKVSAYALA